jgi:hypothetical protein
VTIAELKEILQLLPAEQELSVQAEALQLTSGAVSFSIPTTAPEKPAPTFDPFDL